MRAAEAMGWTPQTLWDSTLKEFWVFFAAWERRNCSSDEPDPEDEGVSREDLEDMSERFADTKSIRNKSGVRKGIPDSLKPKKKVLRHGRT